MSKISHIYIRLTDILDSKILILYMQASNLWPKYKKYTINMKIIIKNLAKEIYYFINIIECFFKFLKQIYFIITIKILDIKPDLVFQIFFKAINN